MSITLYHHPWSRAATVVWMLEEIGEPYELVYVDLRAGDQKSEAHTSRNRMGKIPVLEDGDTLVSESAAIGIYLADRYALERLAPALDDPARGPYLRWSVFGAVVVEPACMAKSAGWEYKPGQAGFGTYESVISTLDEALAVGPWLLGERFTMADVSLGATLRWMLQFDMIGPGQHIAGYAARLGERPALQRADAKNAAVVEERGLTMG